MGSIAKEFTCLTSFLAVEQMDGVLVLRCTDDFMFLALDLERKEMLWRLLDTASTSPEVRAVALLGTPTCFAAQQLRRFWRSVLGRDGPEATRMRQAAAGRTGVRREGSGLQQFAAKVRECRKVVVSALQGEVCTPFLGSALVCDYRVAARGTVFRNNALELGLPPGGALARLLVLHVGLGKARTLLLNGLDIDADEALRLGLIDRIVPTKELGAAALATAAHFAAMPVEAIAATKGVLNDCLVGLDEHFQLGEQWLERCLNDVDLDRLRGECLETASSGGPHEEKS
jgi:2-(1,2-epoxy-1,2-dihydrophenyl)acetyl-CoA isomerase